MPALRFPPATRFEWLLPTLLAAAVATGISPLSAAAGLLLLGYLPGRLIVRGLRLASEWDGAGRCLLAVAFSLSVTPVVLNPLWHCTNGRWPLLGAVWLLLTLAAVAVSLSRPPDRRGPDELRHRLFDGAPARILALALAALVAFSTIGPYWPTELRGYPVPALIHDFIKHHAVLFSLQQRPLPLGNPFFAADADGPVYYYHFFYLLPATLRAWSSGLSIELAFGLQSALVGVCTAGMLYLTVKRLSGGDGPAMLAGLLATAVGGLDVIPLLVRRQPTITLDAWADHAVRIHNFLNQMIWSPQNVQGVLIMLVGGYLLSGRGGTASAIPRRGEPGGQSNHPAPGSAPCALPSKQEGAGHGSWLYGRLVLGAILGASLIGSSIWISLAALPGLVIFGIGAVAGALRKRRLTTRHVLTGALGALLMLGLAAPSLLGYVRMSGRHERGLTVNWPYQSHALLGRLVPPGQLANLLDLPWVLALELGPLVFFPLLASRGHWRRVWNDAGLRWLLLSALVAVAGFVTVRSDFTYNDFGQKIMLVAMAAGIVLAAGVLAPQSRRPTLLNPLGWSLPGQLPTRSRRPLAAFVALLLALGLPVGTYEAPLTAVRRYLSAHGPLGVLAHETAVRAARESGAYRFLRYDLPHDAVIQAHWGAERLDLVQVARKQAGVTVLERDTMVFQPADARAHARALDEVASVLGQPCAASICAATLRAHRVTHVYVGEIERRHWRGLEKFTDQRCFQPVFGDEAATVFAVRVP